MCLMLMMLELLRGAIGGGGRTGIGDDLAFVLGSDEVLDELVYWNTTL